jgi:hypothetical protein
MRHVVRYMWGGPAGMAPLLALLAVAAAVPCRLGADELSLERLLGLRRPKDEPSRLVTRPAAGQKLLRDYDFKESLKDGTKAGPELRSLGGSVGDGAYSFAAGNGLEVTRLGVTDHYALEIVFRFDDVDDWQKVLDFKNREADAGLYVYNGQLQFYSLGTGGDVRPGHDCRARLERDRTSKLVRGFLNDQLVFQFIDTDGGAVFENETAHFFVDDSSTEDEQTSGSVSRIRVWDSPGFAVVKPEPAKPAAGTGKLIRQYDFKQSLIDSLEKGPVLISLDGAVGNGLYTFAAGHGLQLEATGVTDHYAVEITFRFDSVDGWRKVLDFKNRESDNGLYVYNGQLQFYSFAPAGAFQAGRDYRVRLERDRTTRMVRGFIDDEPAFEFEDREGDAVFQNEKAGFFLDDLSTSEEQSSGSASRIRIWDAPGGR